MSDSAKPCNEGNTGISSLAELEDKKVLIATVGCINYDHDLNHTDPIMRLFPRSIRYNYYERMSDLGREKMNQELLQIAKTERPDYLFYVTFLNHLKLETLERMRDLGIVTIAWFSDDDWRYECFSRKLARCIDFQITTYPQAYDKYVADGFSPMLSQWAASPKSYKPRTELEYKHEVSFVGGRHGGRKEFIDGLVAAGIDVRTFGSGWNRFLSFDEMLDVFSQSKINLNFSSSSVDRSLKQIKGRVFEVPMCGGFLLTEDSPRLGEFFEEGREVATFKDLEDAIDKIRYYLKNEDEREAMAAAAHTRALKEHTWEKRLKEIFLEIQKVESSNSNFKRPNSIERFINRILKRHWLWELKPRDRFRNLLRSIKAEIKTRISD